VSGDSQAIRHGKSAASDAAPENGIVLECFAAELK
jgi:hypothetical protein